VPCKSSDAPIKNQNTEVEIETDAEDAESIEFPLIRMFAKIRKE
jgi:hypothetical protein